MTTPAPINTATTHHMDFSDALKKLRSDLDNTTAIHRQGWNGQGMYVAFTPSLEVGPDRIFSAAIREEITVRGTHGVFREYLTLRTANGEFVPWVATQSDILADDWMVLVNGGPTQVPAVSPAGVIPATPVGPVV